MSVFLSPEAEKATIESRARARAYWPALYRDESHALILRPLAGGPHHQVNMAWFIRDNLPQFKFNSRLDRWEGPLEALREAYEKLAPKVCVSDGVLAWLKQADAKEQEKI